MAFSRNSVIAAIAGSVSLAILTGCPQTPTTPTTPGTSPSAPSGSAAPTSPAPSGSVAPTSPAPSGSVAPSVVPSAPTDLKATTVNGTVYDEEGAPVSAAKVRIESLNPSAPFDSTVDVTNGAWVANSVPAGVQVRITATREGWTSRSRVTTLLPIGEGRRNEVNFGGPTDTEDPSGPAYFISDYPEVAAVEPADNADNVSNANVTVKLTLSEALDSTNQRRFADAIRVLPGEPDADPLGSATAATTVDYLSEQDQAATITGVSTLDGDIYQISEDSTFLGDEDTKASVSWDSTGTVATLTFNAPLLANEDENLRYVVALVSNAAGDAIEDKSGNNLGSGTTSLDGAYGASKLIGYAFQEPSLAVDSADLASDDSRWRATHEHFTEFELASDETDPTLTGVTVTTPTLTAGQITRISLTFSEPMAAFAGGSRVVLGSIGNTPLTVNKALNTRTLLEAFTFAVGETAADLDDVTLDGDSPATASAGWGGDSSQRETEFILPTTTTVSVNPDDAKTLRLEITGGQFFDDKVNAIKARVEGLTDPAGNAITEASADANEKVGSI